MGSCHLRYLHIALLCWSCAPIVDFGVQRCINCYRGWCSVLEAGDCNRLDRRCYSVISGSTSTTGIIAAHMCIIDFFTD